MQIIQTMTFDKKLRPGCKTQKNRSARKTLLFFYSLLPSSGTLFLCRFFGTGSGFCPQDPYLFNQGAR